MLAFKTLNLTMPKLVPIKPKKLVKILLFLEFKRRDAEGSHVFFGHSDGRTTVANYEYTDSLSPQKDALDLQIFINKNNKQYHYGK